MANGVRNIGHILPQANGFYLVGMPDSLGKMFRTAQAAAKYASRKGLVLKLSKGVTVQPTDETEE